MVLNPLSPSSASSGSLTPAPVSGGYGLLDDVPPSYDSISTPSASAPSVAGGSSSGAAAAGPSRAWPESMDTLFTGPPNGEPLITRTRAGELPTIESHFVGKATKNGRLESWDKQLNDPVVLYDFIRAQALKHPKVVIRCKGTHQETASHTGMVISNGSPQHVHAGTKYTVVDFDFTIDLSPVLEHTENYANVHLQAKRAHVPAYRGGFQRTYGTAAAPNAFLGSVSHGKVASWSENSRWDAWAQFMKMRGRAPWSDMEADEEFRSTYNRVPSASIALGTDEEALLGGQLHNDDETPLRQWCEAYCADPGILKSFTLSKAIWGWDLANLKSAIERAILSTGYDGMLDGYNVHIDYQFDEDYQVVVRPDNWLVRIVNHPFWFVILCVTCIYPFIWIWQRLSRYGGGSYEVAVASYGMKFYPPLPSTFPGETIDHARDRLPAMFKLHPEVPRQPFLHRGPKGIHYLLGRREGEWFREWEERIRMAVRMKYSGELVNTRVAEEEEPPELDGY